MTFCPKLKSDWTNLQNNIKRGKTGKINCYNTGISVWQSNWMENHCNMKKSGPCPIIFISTPKWILAAFGGGRIRCIVRSMILLP